MDSKDERKKESIDEILADLNDLLNKMPSILDGVRMPEIKPVVPVIPLPEEPVAPSGPPQSVDADDVRGRPAHGADMNADNGNFERIINNNEPDKPACSPAAEAAGRGSDETGGEKLVVQPLGEYLFSAGAEEEHTGPAGIKPEPDGPVRPENPAGDSSDSGREPVPETPQITPGVHADSPTPAPEPANPAPSFEAEETAPGEAFKMSLGNGEQDKNDGAYGATRNFGVPDIDMLLKISQTSGGGVVQEAPAGRAEPSNIEQEAVVENAEGGTVEGKEEKLENEEAAIVPAPGTGGEGIQLEPRVMPEPSETLSLASDVSAGPAVPPAGAPEPLPEEEKTMLIAPTAAATQPEEDKPPVLETAGGVCAPSADAQAPQPEEKTVMYEAGSDPAATGRRRNDLNELAVKTAPDGIPEERVRTLAVLYVASDAELCAEALSELDAICLKSAAKPMFIKRGFVKLCEAGMNGNYVLQMVSDVKAAGLLCVGSIPQENIYEIENAFSSSGVFFKHVKMENFNRSAMLDLVTELILK